MSSKFTNFFRNWQAWQYGADVDRSNITGQQYTWDDLSKLGAGYLTNLYENDPRARGYGYDTRTFQPGDPTSAISRAEVFGVNELNQGRRYDQAGMGIVDASNQAGLAQRLAAARKDAASFSDTQAGRFERETRGMGLSDRQQRAAKQRMSLNRAVSEVSAMAGTRRASTQTAQEANRMGGFLANMNLGQAASTYGGMANAEGQERIRAAQEAAAEKGAKNNMIGQAIGAVITIAAAASSESWKDKVEENPDLLNKLKKLRVDKWKYKGDEHDHVGPYAEEFNETFGTEGAAGDRRFINLIDAVGVALGAVKQLDQKVEALQNG